MSYQVVKSIIHKSFNMCFFSAKNLLDLKTFSKHHNRLDVKKG